jgi:hypothetical protein
MFGLPSQCMEFYISQLRRYARAFSLYSDFLQRHRIMCTNKKVDFKLLNRGYIFNPRDTEVVIYIILVLLMRTDGLRHYLNIR